MSKGIFATRLGSRVGSMAKRKASLGRLVEMILACTHSVYFNDKIKPTRGEIIWCSKCADYKQVE